MPFARPLVAVLLVTLIFISIPSVSFAVTKFDNPLGISSPKVAIENLITRLVIFLLSLSVTVALIALLYGGLKLIFGGMGSDQQIAQGKQIILWAVLGLLVIGAAWSILLAVRFVLNV